MGGGGQSASSSTTKAGPDTVSTADLGVYKDDIRPLTQVLSWLFSLPLSLSSRYAQVSSNSQHCPRSIQNSPQRKYYFKYHFIHTPSAHGVIMDLTHSTNTQRSKAGPYIVPYT